MPSIFDIKSKNQKEKLKFKEIKIEGEEIEKRRSLGFVLAYNFFVSCKSFI